MERSTSGMCVSYYRARKDGNDEVVRWERWNTLRNSDLGRFGFV